MDSIHSVDPSSSEFACINRSPAAVADLALANLVKGTIIEFNVRCGVAIDARERVVCLQEDDKITDIGDIRKDLTERARDRGNLRADLDPVALLDQLAAVLSYRVLITGAQSTASTPQSWWTKPGDQGAPR